MTTRKKITFKNAAGLKLAAVLEYPSGPVKYHALYAHCFSCGKDIITATRISRALARQGIAVFRFDFTGLGESEGDFDSTNFTSNVEDLLSAVAYLREHYQPPQLLIGHSLGGTAVLHAADKITESKAVVTIGSPATPEHILKHFAEELKELENNEAVPVTLGPTSFEIQQQFVEDVQARSTTEKISDLRKALLVFHSPIDAVVSIDEATRIFVAAKHPKSFITLDQADHLLSNAKDAEYVANTIAAWAARYTEDGTKQPQPVSQGQLMVDEGNHKFLREVISDDHRWLADEPKAMGGDNLGPDPYEQLLASLGTCTSMTLRMYANHKQWDIEDIRVELKHSREHQSDCEEPDDKSCKLDVIEKVITIEGDLDDQQLHRLLEVADRCPVHKTLMNDIRVETNINYKKG